MLVDEKLHQDDHVNAITSHITALYHLFRDPIRPSGCILMYRPLVRLLHVSFCSRLSISSLLLLDILPHSFSPVLLDDM